MTFDLPRVVIDFLAERPSQRFTMSAIVRWIVENFHDECEKQMVASGITNPNVKLYIIAVIAIRRSKMQDRHPQFKVTEGRPRLYYWDPNTDQNEVTEVDEADTGVMEASGGSPIKESDLYPLLSNYLWSEHSIYPLRIDEKKSSNTKGPKGNRWLYPDLVGMENLQDDWHQEVKHVAKEYPGKRTKLWSFEVKVTLKRSNVREAFFQATSNSSWANFGYLVADSIVSDGSLKELRMLASLHGIGLINLNSENPDESQIIIPAREKPDVDWATCNRLTQENNDFNQFMKLIRQFYQTGDLCPNDWDLPGDLLASLHS